MASFPFNRRTSPAAVLQMIDFSTVGSWQPGVNKMVHANDSEELLKGNDETEVSSGDIVVIETPGGGGFGAA